MLNWISVLVRSDWPATWEAQGGGDGFYWYTVEHLHCVDGWKFVVFQGHRRAQCDGRTRLGRFDTLAEAQACGDEKNTFEVGYLARARARWA